MSWQRYLKIGISGFLSDTLIVLIMAYALLGTRIDVKLAGDGAYWAEAAAS